MTRIFFPILIVNLVLSLSSWASIDAPVEKKWAVGGKDGSASASSTAEDGSTRLNIGCNRRLGRTVAGSLNGYKGNALARMDDHAEPVIFEIEGAHGKLSSFKGEINYYAPDQAWSYGNFPLELLNAFESGRKLSLHNGKGIIIAQFNLHRAASARVFMKNVCGF